MFVVAFMSVIVFSCAVTQESQFVGKKLTHCEKPGSQVCTGEHLPVCGFEADGNHKTYSNACVACSNTNVVSYDEGVCK